MLSSTTPPASSAATRANPMASSIIGFTAASMLCGAAQNLVEIVLFRLLQGVCGAALVPRR